MNTEIVNKLQRTLAKNHFNRKAVRIITRCNNEIEKKQQPGLKPFLQLAVFVTDAEYTDMVNYLEKDYVEWDGYRFVVITTKETGNGVILFYLQGLVYFYCPVSEKTYRVIVRDARSKSTNHRKQNAGDPPVEARKQAPAHTS